MDIKVSKSWLLIFVVALLCGLAPQEANAYSFRQNENGRVQHWKRDRFPVEFVLHADGCPTIPLEQLQQIIPTVLSAWSTVTCSYAALKGASVARGTNAPTVDGNNVIRFITKGEDWQWDSGFVIYPVITTQLRTGEITDADILFNSWKYTFSTAGQPADFDFQSVLMNAIGTALGLGDSKDKNAVMYDKINPGETGKRILSEDDKQGICDLYPKDPPCKEGELVGNTHTCFNGRVEPICPPYSEVCKECQSDLDCRGNRNFCLYSIDSGRCGMECGVGGACPKGYSCVKILDPNTQAEIGANCAPDDGTCANAASLPCCRSNDDCLPGFTCNLQVCIKSQITDPCGGLCKSHEQCINGKCEVSGCTSNDQCGIGWTCLNSRCIPDGGCSGGCPDGQSCSNGKCAGNMGTACLGDEQCTQGLLCATGRGLKLCSKSCNSASDCENGFFCVVGLNGTITKGCWPATRTTCNDGTCIPKGNGGCNCNTGSPPPIFETIFLLALLLGLRVFSRKIGTLT